MLVARRKVILPTGPVQECIYTITLEERFVIPGDICYAQIPAEPWMLEDLKKLPVTEPTEPLELKLDKQMHTKPYIYDSYPAEEAEQWNRRWRRAPIIEN